MRRLGSMTRCSAVSVVQRVMAIRSISSTDITNHLRTQCRQTWVEVDLDAAESNTTHLRALANTPGFIAVVKADAYGHGAVHVGHSAIRAGASLLAVATLEEALALRKYATNSTKAHA
jgi:hypothetical protein